MTLLLLPQFFTRHLLRKAEGYGPLTPWQPLLFTQRYEGANSIRCKREDRSEYSLVLDTTSSKYFKLT